MTLASLEHGPDLQPLAIAAPPVPGSDGWRVHVYAHTHWDREWYRTFERFRLQLVGMVDRVLDVLDSDPRFATFVLDGQTIVLEDYLEIRPEEEPRIRRLVGAGRLEVGPWHVLPDEFLVSGESMVRNLLEGRRVASRFGEPLAVGYLPDPFGHVGQLPAILRGFGIDNVIFSRGMGDEHARTGNEFRWESTGGRESVIALVQGSPYTSGYCNAETLGRGNGADDPSGYGRVRELVPHLVSQAHADALLLAAGCDHETVQQELPLIVERIGEMIPGADVRITGLHAYVASVRDAERRLEQSGAALERFRGELRGSRYAPVLSSIFSARVALKQDNDRIQTLLERHVEPLMATAVAAGVRPLRDVQPFLRHAWRLVLENHPHDSIGGCSIDDVHLEMPARSLRVDATGHALLEDLRIALQLGNEAVVHDSEGRGGIGDRADGTAVALAPGRPGRLERLDDLARDTGADVVSDTEVAGGELTARVRDGALELVRGDCVIRLDWVDRADAGDEYDFGAVPGDTELVATIDRVATRPAGPGVAELDIVHVLDLPVSLTDDRSTRSSTTKRHEVRTRVRVSDASALARLTVEFDNQSSDHRLRLRASVDGLAATDLIQALGHFSVVERPVRHAPTDVPWRQEPTQLDHCAGAVQAGGVLLAGRGIHEYEADVDQLELTVLRSVGWLSRNDIPGRPGHAGPALATPQAQCHGRHLVELAVGIEASFDDARAFLAGPLVLEPFNVAQSQEPGTGLDSLFVMESGAIARARDVLAVTPEDALDRIDGLGIVVDATGGAVPSAWKLADDGSGDLLVRWWAPEHAEGARGRLSVGPRVRDVLRARLDETTLGPAAIDDGIVDVAVAPGAIVTLRLRLER